MQDYEKKRLVYEADLAHRRWLIAQLERDFVIPARQRDIPADLEILAIDSSGASLIESLPVEEAVRLFIVWYWARRAMQPIMNYARAVEHERRPGPEGEAQV